MRYSQALNAMLNGYHVALPNEEGVFYSFDGGEMHLHIWYHNEISDQMHHIDNVDFDRMMRKDWYILPEKRYFTRRSTREWAIRNWLCRSRFSMLDSICITGMVTMTVAYPGWGGFIVSMLLGIIGLLGSLFLDKKWQTHV